VKCGNGIVIKAGPGVFPPVEVCHPVRNIDVDPINAGRGDLPHPFHISFPPCWRVRADPHVFITLRDPEGGASSKNRGLSGDRPLQPIRIFFGQRVGSLIRIGGNALGSRDVYESSVAHRVCGVGEGTDCLQLLLGIHEAFITAGYVVVHLNPEDAAFLSVTHDLARVVACQTVRPDAHIVGPVLFHSTWSRPQSRSEEEQGNCRSRQAFSHRARTQSALQVGRGAA